MTEQIRHGKLRPILDLGVTPSQVSLHVTEEGRGRGWEEGEEEVDGSGEEGAQTFCIPLQSLGLGGNKITCLGAGCLADGLKTNTSKFNVKTIIISYVSWMIEKTKQIIKKRFL